MSRSTAIDRTEERRHTTDLRPAVQLYTLRALDDSLPETIRRVADAGFEGVEFAGQFLESDPQAVRAALDATDTVPIGAHVGLRQIEGNVESIADRCRRVGCDRVIVPHLGARYFRTTDQVDSLARRLEDLAGRLENRGLHFTYHTSRHPFLPMLDMFGPVTSTALPIPDGLWQIVSDGIDVVVPRASRPLDQTAFARLVSGTTDLTFEVDLGWVVAAGYDPAEVFELLGDRTSLVHLADVDRVRRFPPAFRSVPPCQGLLDLDQVRSAVADAEIEWLVYEDDDPADATAAIGQGITAIAPFLGANAPE